MAKEKLLYIVIRAHPATAAIRRTKRAGLYEFLGTKRAPPVQL